MMVVFFEAGRVELVSLVELTALTGPSEMCSFYITHLMHVWFPYRKRRSSLDKNNSGDPISSSEVLSYQVV